MGQSWSGEARENQYIRSWRKEAPAHYILKIDSFSSVVSSISKYESRVFEASGYKWKLLLCPKEVQANGIPKSISLYLEISENDNTLPPGWEINAIVNFFVYNYQIDEYFSNQYGKLHRFHETNRLYECGLNSSYIDSLKNPSYGYLKNGQCVFGVEVFVVKNQGKGETLSMKKEPNLSNTLTWKIDKFSELTDECYYSKAFSYGGCEWKLIPYPKGDGSEWKGKCVSLYLEVHNPQNLSPGWEKYVKYKLRIRNQVSDNHKEFTGIDKFCAAYPGWGLTNFLPLAHLNSPMDGYLVKDTLIVEAEIIAFSEIKEFPQ